MFNNETQVIHCDDISKIKNIINIMIKNIINNAKNIYAY